MAFLRTLALGAGAMYLLDPEKGTERRQKIRDGFNGFINDLNQSFESGVEDLKHRVEDVKEQLHGEGRPGHTGFEGMQLSGELPPAAKLVAAAGGTAMIFYGALRGHITPIMLGSVGVGLATRGTLGTCASEAGSAEQKKMGASQSGSKTQSSTGARSGKQELSGVSAGI